MTFWILYLKNDSHMFFGGFTNKKSMKTSIMLWSLGSGKIQETIKIHEKPILIAKKKTQYDWFPGRFKIQRS